MSEHQQIAGIVPGDPVQSVYYLSSAALHESRNGPYWRLELRDASGTAEAKIWSPLSQRIQGISAGMAVEVSGKSGTYRDQLQITVDDLRILSADEMNALDPADYMPSAPRSSNEMMEELESMCGAVLTHRPWLVLMQSVLGDSRIRTRFMRAAGAKNVHHAYAGGLLEHSLSVAKLCMAIAACYPELDRQLLLSAAVLHDIGKIDEMAGTLSTEYTGEGQMLGHLVQGLLLLEPFILQSGLEPEIAAHFRHLIASHHGQADFGAIKEPVTIEAFVLHHADDIDAKTAYFRTNFPERDGSTESYWAYMQLYRRELCRPMHTPQAGEKGGEDGLEQCHSAGGATACSALEFRLGREVQAREALELENAALKAEKKALESEVKKLRKAARPAGGQLTLPGLGMPLKADSAHAVQSVDPEPEMPF